MACWEKRLAFAWYSVFALVVVLLFTEYTKAAKNLGHGSSPDLNECSLSPQTLARLHDRKAFVWTITDELLRQLDNDLQRIIDCTKSADILYLETTQTITPNATLIIPWDLVIRGSFKRPATTARGEDSKEEPLPVSFTCPETGGVMISKSRWLDIDNVQFIGCRNSGTIISIESDCLGAEGDNYIEANYVEFKDNLLYRDQRIIDFKYPQCSRLSLNTVVIHNNTCDSQHCIALPLSSTLWSINATQNAGHQSSLPSQAVFLLPNQSDVSATLVNASRNEIRIFGMEGYATLKLVQSKFHENSPVLSTVPHESVKGGVLYAKNSTVSIERCTFNSNTAPTGGVLFSIDSQVNLLECSFVGNLAKEYNGGALLVNSSTLNVSQSSFERNEAARSGAMLFADLSTATILLTNITKSQSELSGTVFLRNCTVNLGGVMFRDNLAQWLGGALYASGSDVKIEESKFVENNASSGSAISLRYQTNASISRSLFSGNNARHFGAMHTNEGSKVEIQESRFELNIANSGGAIYLVTGASVKIHRSFIFTSKARYSGGGVFARFRAKFISSRTYFADNEAKDGDGGGIFSESSDVFMYSTIFDSNIAKSGGGVHITDASIRMFNCNFTYQHASKNGGGLYFARSGVHFRGSFIIYNKAALDGGGIYATNETRLKGKDSRFYINLAVKRGGGLALMDGSVFKCIACDIVDNKAEIGPDVYKEPHRPIT